MVPVLQGIRVRREPSWEFSSQPQRAWRVPRAAGEFEDASSDHILRTAPAARDRRRRKSLHAGPFDEAL